MRTQSSRVIYSSKEVAWKSWEPFSKQDCSPVVFIDNALPPLTTSLFCLLLLSGLVTGVHLFGNKGLYILNDFSPEPTKGNRTTSPEQVDFYFDRVQSLAEISLSIDHKAVIYIYFFFLSNIFLQRGDSWDSFRVTQKSALDKDRFLKMDQFGRGNKKYARILLS